LHVISERQEPRQLFPNMPGDGGGQDRVYKIPVFVHFVSKWKKKTTCTVQYVMCRSKILSLVTVYVSFCVSSDFVMRIYFTSHVAENS